MSWNIWLAITDQIFNNSEHLPLKVATKAKALLIEKVGIQTFKEGYSLLLEEKKWMGIYTFRDRKKKYVIIFLSFKLALS